MPQLTVVKSGRAALVALGLALVMSCSTAPPPPPAAVTSAGRGAPVSPAIPWEMWRNADDIEAFPLTEMRVIPSSTGSSGRSMPAHRQPAQGVPGARPERRAPAGIEPLKVRHLHVEGFLRRPCALTDKRYFRCNAPTASSSSGAAA
jgi:hypothetical protein